jgi:hypothetical protein
METRRRALLVVVGIVLIFLVGRWIFGGSAPEAPEVASAPEAPAVAPAPAPTTPPSPAPSPAPPSASPPPAAAPVPAGTIKLTSHRAVYDLKLKSARSNSGISSLDGRMVMEWADSCDGATLNQRIQTRAYDGEGQPLVTDFRISTWEARDGHSFRFSARQETDGDVTEEFEGKGTTDGDGAGSVVYTKPPERTLKLAPGTFFPNSHTQALIQSALAGKSILTAKVFDGSGPDTAYEAVGAIGKEEPADANLPAINGIALLKGQRSWPMRLAYYPLGKTDGLPEYEIGFRMFANGVSTDLELDYGDFTVAGVLSQIEALPDPGC